MNTELSNCRPGLELGGGLIDEGGMTPLSIIEHFEMFKDQRSPAWLPPVTDTGDDGLIPVSTFRRSSRHKRCPSSCLGETCSPSCLLLAGAAGRPSPHTDRHDRNGGAGQASADGGGAPSASRQSVEPAVYGRGSQSSVGWRYNVHLDPGGLALSGRTP